ncbi:MAG: ion channel [Saprospiraceae bacterium]
MSNFRFNSIKKTNPDIDSGFGSSYSGENERVLNNKGNFNVKRIGTPAISIFHELLALSWSKILILILLFYIVANLFFAGIYYLLGPNSLEGISQKEGWLNFMECFFFSVQTFTTVGYGALHPKGMFSSSVAGLEALSGLLTFAIITGLVYSKFSKPNFNLSYSKNLIISPYKDITGAMFRVVNPLRQKLMDVEATMIFAFIPEESGARMFRTLELEIKKISMFPISWTVNHPITQESPLFGLKNEDFAKIKAEMLVMISAYDEESGRVIKNLSSYHFSQFQCNAKFSPMIEIVKGQTQLYLDRVSDIINL